MSTPQYPRLMASEGLLGMVGDVLGSGYDLRAVAADAQFCTRLVMRSLKLQGVPFVLRCRSDAWVELGRERVQVRDLAQRYPPGRARYYRRYGVYAKRLRVFLTEVGRLALLLIWKRQGPQWVCLVLLSRCVKACRAYWRSGNSGGTWRQATACTSSPSVWARACAGRSQRN